MGEMEKNKVEDVVSSCANLKGAVLEPEDIAEAALYLVSDESKYVSGMNLVVDGGEATARLFVRHGAKVLIVDVQDELGHSVCKDIGSESIFYIHCDVTNEYDVEKAIDMVVSKYGKLDIMFNNHAARVMIPAKKGSILFTSSIASVMADDVSHAYVASKHVVVGMVKKLSVELDSME
nr:secoisolariciresinol dehydrogenase [Quercus suber]